MVIQQHRVRVIVAKSMGYVLKLALIAAVIGLVLKFLGVPESEKIFSGICYLISFSPFLFTFIIAVGYLIEKNYKGSILGALVFLAILASLFVKG